MSGKIFVGNTSNIATLPKNILVGDSSNIARNVKEIYVGNSQNQAVKVWPNRILPDTYQQVEYMGINNYGTNAFTSLIFTNYYIQCRAVLNFKVYKHSNEDTSFLTMLSSTDLPCETCINYNHIYFRYGDETYYSYPNEKVLTKTRYTIDCNNILNNVSRFFIYNSEGYYSNPANNLVASTPKLSSAVQTSQTAQCMQVVKYSYIEFYRLTLYNNNGSNSGNIVHDFYPCYRKIDRQAGYYDIVDRMFYEVKPSYYHKIQIYLGSNVN